MDFDQTFSPTAKWASLRAILAIVALEDLKCISVDISRAFLNGDMEHDVYMDFFKGYEELGLGKPKSSYMFIASKDLSRARQVVADLEKQFQLHDLGDTSFLLGVHIQRDRSRHSLSLSQTQYIVDVLEQYSMSDCVAVSTPLDPNSKLC